MEVVKKHRWKLILILSLLSAASLCAYTLVNYQGDTDARRSGIRTYLTEQGGRPSFGTHRQPGGQWPPQGAERSAPSDGGWAGRSDSVAAGSSYAPQLYTYAAVFFALFMAAYFLLIYQKRQINPVPGRMVILALLGIGLLLRISAATLTAGHPFDISLFKSWATAAAGNLFQVYAQSGATDYPPLYMYILFLIGKAAAIPAISHYYILLLKLPSILADIATSALIYQLAKKYLPPGMGVLLAAFYLFNPAVVINSTFWGQVDSFFTLIVALAVVALAEKRTGPAAALFAAAVLMKPQGIIFLPVLLFELFRQKSVRSLISAALYGLGTAAVIVLPFALSKGWLWIFQLYANTLGEYPYASVNAFNLYGLLGANYKSDALSAFFLSYHGWGMVFIVLVTALSWVIYHRGRSSGYAPAAALLLIAGVFTLATSMHERYLFPAAALAILAFIYLRDRRLLLLAAGLSLTVFVNTAVVLLAINRGVNAISSGAAPVLTALLNLLLLAYLIRVLYDIAVRKRTAAIAPPAASVW